MTVVFIYQFVQTPGAFYFIFYAVKVFDDVGLNGGLLALIMMASQVLAGILLPFLVDLGGRKLLIVFGLIFQGIATLGVMAMLFFKWYGLIELACVFIMLGYGLHRGTAFPWIAETVPNIGTGLSFSWQLFCTMVFAQISPIMTDGFPGFLATLGIWVLVNFCGALVLQCLVFETKGKLEDEILREYLNFKCRCAVGYGKTKK